MAESDGKSDSGGQKSKYATVEDWVNSLGLSPEEAEGSLQKLAAKEVKIDLVPFLSVEDLKETGISDTALEAMTKSIEELRKESPSKDSKTEEKLGYDSVYVRDIDPAVTDDDFIKVFNSVGQVTTIKRFPEHRYAFVCYFDNKGAEAAVAKLSNTNLGKLVIKVQVIEPTNSLWVGNVVGCSEDEIKKIFGKHGIIVRTNVLPAKQCAFVTFSSAKEAATARHALEGQKLGELLLTINFKINKKERPRRRERDGPRDRDRDRRSDRDRPKRRRERDYDRYNDFYDDPYDYDTFDSYGPYRGPPPPPPPPPGPGSYDSYSFDRGGPGFRRRPPPPLPPPRRRGGDRRGSEPRGPQGGRGGRGGRRGRGGPL